MTSSSNLILQHYIKLTEFLGKALGPDYEVALHDLTVPSSPSPIIISAAGRSARL